MTETGHFFDGVNHTESMMAEVLADLLPDGVIRTGTTRLAVSAVGALSVNVAAGRAMVQGFWYSNSATITLPITPNSSGSTRIDRVVLALDRSANTLQVVVRAGTPGSGLPPTLTRVVGGSWEISLAKVTVTNGTAGIAPGDVTDERSDPVYCGYTGGNKRSALRLNTTIAVDVVNGFASSANAWTTAGTAQNFTVEEPTSIVLITIRGNPQAFHDSSHVNGTFACSITVDSVRYPGGGEWWVGTSQFHGFWNGVGVLVLTGLSAGNHTVVAEYVEGNGGIQVFWRCASQAPYENLQYEVIELFP
jgi:hypothetical protein